MSQMSFMYSQETNATEMLKCHQCELCNKIFVNPGLLKIHKARIHKTFVNEKKNDRESEDILAEDRADGRMPENVETLGELMVTKDTFKKYNKYANIVISEGDESQDSDENYEPEVRRRNNLKIQ